MGPAAALERTLHDEIPLARAMGVRVAAYDGTTLKLAAPLAPNINHKCTAFGGSLYSLAVLCGWGMVHLKLAEASLHKHIVIQESAIRYLLPVDQDMQAECHLDEDVFGKFLRTLEKHGRARLSLDVVIKRNGQPAVEFSGRYVVHG
ncbi:MAG: YiiD C-terminal domain-containing protein [Nitrosomonadales bacterium]|nr:YiiD C-terminal domain-containing protein [Nitrosomonadales bacterium]